MKLKQISLKEFEEYLSYAIDNYAQELTTSGNAPKEKAKEVSEKTFHQVLPEGLNTDKHYLYKAYDEQKHIGFIWYGFRDDTTAFIYDFSIEKEHRRKGYGKKVMLACEEDAKQKGAKVMKLHVFGHNKAAIALYKALGYEPMSIHMKKDL